MIHRNGAAILAAAAMLACSGLVYAQDTTLPAPATAEPKTPLMAALDGLGIGSALADANISVFGHIEGSWTYSTSNPPDNFIDGRAFDFENQDLTLNQLMLAIERPVEVTSDKFDIGARVEWLWGADARKLHSTGLFDHYDGTPENEFDLTQAYVDLAIPVGNGLRLRAGKFVTLYGYEVIDPTGNLLYSHSYLFGAIPFTHTGVMGAYALNDKLTVDAAVTRGWDDALEDKNSALDFVGRVTYTLDDKTTLYFIGGTGPERAGDNDVHRSAFNVLMNHQVADNLSVGAEGLWVLDGGMDNQWYGAAGYVSYTLSPMFTLNGRGEWFRDEDGVVTGAANTLYEATFGLAITPLPNDRWLQSFVVRPEIRYDYAQTPFFDGGSQHDQWTLGIDAYYAF